MDPGLKTFIRLQQRQGIPDESIRANLQGAGWHESEIAEAFRVIALPEEDPKRMGVSLLVLALSLLLALLYFTGAFSLWTENEVQIPTITPVPSTITAASLEYTTRAELDDKIAALQSHASAQEAFYQTAIHYLETRAALLDMQEALRAALNSEFAPETKDSLIQSLERATAAARNIDPLMLEALRKDTRLDVTIPTAHTLSLLSTLFIREYTHSSIEESPSGATRARTVEEANKIVTSLIEPLHLEEYVIAYWPTLLNKRSRLKPFIGSAFALQGSYWLYYLDLQPERYFSHDVKYLLINAENGNYVLTDESWFPVIDGTTMLATTAGRTAALQNDSRKEQNKRNQKPLSLIATARAADTAMSQAHAVFYTGWPDMQAFSNSASLLQQTLKQQGYEDAHLHSVQLPSSAGSSDVNVNAAYTALKEKISEASGSLHCEDTLTLYMTGHGGTMPYIGWRNRKTKEYKELLAVGELNKENSFPYATSEESEAWEIQDVKYKWFIVSAPEGDADVNRATYRLMTVKPTIIITDEQLASILTDIPSCNKQVMLDVSASGIAAPYFAKKVEGMTVYAATGDDVNESAIATTGALQSPGILGSFSELQSKVTDQLQSGLFTRRFTDALQNNAENDTEWFSKAYTETAKAFPKLYDLQNPAMATSPKACTCEEEN